MHIADNCSPGNLDRNKLNLLQDSGLKNLEGFGAVDTSVSRNILDPRKVPLRRGGLQGSLGRSDIQVTWTGSRKLCTQEEPHHHAKWHAYLSKATFGGDLSNHVAVRRPY